MKRSGEEKVKSKKSFSQMRKIEMERERENRMQEKNGAQNQETPLKAKGLRAQKHLR